MRTAVAWFAIGLALASPAGAQSHMDKMLFLELSSEQDAESWGLLLVHLKGVLAGLEAGNAGALHVVTTDLAPGYPLFLALLMDEDSLLRPAEFVRRVGWVQAVLGSAGTQSR